MNDALVEVNTEISINYGVDYSMEELVFNLLKEKNCISDEDVIAYNEIHVEENEVIIRGNKLGLIQLADYLVQMAINDKDSHHIHLDGNNFFDKANYEMIILKEG